MIRVLTIVTAVAALAVSAAPVGSAGTSKKPPSQGFFLDLGTTETLDLLKAKPKAPAQKAAPPRAGASKARVGGKILWDDISLGFNKQYDMSSPY